MGLQKKRHLKASGADSKTTFSPPILAWLNLWFNFKNGEHMWKHASNYFSQSSTPYVNQGHRYTWLSHGTDLSYCLRHQLWAQGLQSEMAHRGRESTVLTWVCASCFNEDLVLYSDIAILHTSQSPDPRTPHQSVVTGPCPSAHSEPAARKSGCNKCLRLNYSRQSHFDSSTAILTAGQITRKPT